MWKKIKKLIAKWLHQPTRRKAFEGFALSENYLIFRTDQEQQRAISERLIEKLQADDKQYIVLNYSRKGAEALNEARSFRYSGKETDRLGKPRSDKLREIIGQSYDVFIDLHSGDDLHCHYLRRAVKTALVVRVADEDYAESDIHLPAKASADEIAKTLIKYLGVITKHSA